jgi:hypothetical protein
MSRSRALRTIDVHEVRTAFTRGADDRAERLRASADRPIRSARTLREWHDLLLFVAAHPVDEGTYHFARTELSRMRERVRALTGSRASLTNSGLDGTAIEANLSLPLVRWLIARWPNDVSLAAVDADADAVLEVLRVLLLPVEIEAADLLDGSADELLASAFGESRVTQLAQLVARLDDLRAPDAVRDGLYARLDAYISVHEEAACSLSRAAAPHAAPFCHPDALRRGVEVAEVIAEPIAAPVTLPPAARSALIDTARTVLAAMQRETDPVTHASDVTLHDMGRGLRIALYSLDVAHRLPFDSYVGFMAFRNGVPFAYGGAWIFPGRSKIGINVLPSQRGGESAWFFAQLLRLYHQRYDVPCFEVENYQLGHGNSDGLRSGAYWFYYRLGFRPVEGSLRRMAAHEFARLSARRDYVVPTSRLLELVEAGLQLPITAVASDTRARRKALDAPAIDIDTAALTRAVQRHIVSRYRGDREAAQRSAMARIRRVLPQGEGPRWHGPARRALALWALPLDLVPDLEQWSAGDRTLLAQVIRAKSEASERSHQLRLARHRTLLTRWCDVCAAAHAD